MNPQYLPHQQFGGQPQEFGPVNPGPGIPPPGSTDAFSMNSGPAQPPQGGYMQPATPMGYQNPGQIRPFAQKPMMSNTSAPIQHDIPGGQMAPPNQMQQMLPGQSRQLGQGPPQNAFSSPGHGAPLMPPGPGVMQTSPQIKNGPNSGPPPTMMGSSDKELMGRGPAAQWGAPDKGPMGPPGPNPTPPWGMPGNMGPSKTMLPNSGPPTHMGPPLGQMGVPQLNNLGPSGPGQFAPSHGQNINQGSSGHLGPPPGQMGVPPSGQMGVPPPGQMGVPPMNQNSPLQNQMQPQVSKLPPPMQNSPAKAPEPQMNQPLIHPNQSMPQPMPLGQKQSQNMPQQMPLGQFPNKPPLYQNMPPPVGPPGPNQMQQFNPNNPMAVGPNQLTNQMSDLRLYGPPGANKPLLNGDNSPHMPPPLGQNQGYVNGASNRVSQLPPMGYPHPPMPGQPPVMPGQPQMLGQPGPMPGQQGQMPGQQGQMPGQQGQMPGQQGQMPGGPYPPQPSYQQPQQARRLDPDQMPSPIQVTLDDQRTRSGVFCTNQKGLVPPLVSTNFTTQDQGNAGPRYIRSTMYNVPTTTDMMKQTAVPFGLVISPLARALDQEYQPPIVDFGEMGPVRCIRCKAYMSPFMQFIDSGRRFQCLFCKATTEVPADYFQHLDHTGNRVDRYDRPELILGAYEFVATKDYCRNNVYPKEPAIVFVIDVSYNNVKSGLVHLLCGEMKEILKHMAIDQGHEKSKMKVGFITYNNTVHFYNIKGNLAQPQMMVVGDTQEMFMPLLDGFLCDVEDSAAVIDSLMVQIPMMFGETRETETVLLPAIQAGLEALKASECAGKLLVFHSTLPTSAAPGQLKNRDERKLLGTEKERTVLVPQTQAYNQLGQDCVAAGCCVDLFITNNSYIDIATIGQVARLTGGEIFKYTYFQADLDGPRLIGDVITDISRPIAFDSIMRVRTSTGVRPTEFYGHFYMSNTTDMELAAIDCDKAIAIEVKHDDKLTEEEGVYIQVALLYTSCSGQRRLRILNLSLKTCSQMADLYRSCELDTIVNFFAKQCVYRLLENNPKSVKDSLVNRCAQMLACYRKNCASPSSAGQLILPECMKLLPLYVNCLLKSDAMSGGSDMTLDERSFVMQCVTTMDIPTSVAYFYPHLIPLHEILNGTETIEIPDPIRCTVEKMVENGVYLLENGIHMMLWIGQNANQDWIQSVFGVASTAQVDIDRIDLPEFDNSLSVAVRNLVEQVRIQRHRCMRLTLVRQRDKLEAVFRHFLVEDRGQEGSSSYVDFLCHMHKEIRQLLS